MTQGEGYGAHADVAPRADKKLRVHSEGDGFDIGELCDKPVPAGEPGILTAVSPIILVIVLNYLFSELILPALDTSFLALPQYGETDLAAVQGIWSIIAALAGSIVLVMVLNRRRFSDFTNSLDSGANASVMPIFNTASLVGFGAVIATLPSFATIAAGIFRLGGDNPLISLALSVSVLAGITGSASGGMSIVLQSMGAKFTEMAVVSGVSLDLMHRVTALAAGGLDCLPHGGARYYPAPDLQPQPSRFLSRHFRGFRGRARHRPDRRDHSRHPVRLVLKNTGSPGSAGWRIFLSPTFSATNFSFG